jgi:predicted NBD/HSP70 family sugar kinase
MYILFDIGGTKMRLAISRDGKGFDKPKVVKTPTDFSEAISLIKKTALELSEGKEIKAAAGGVRALARTKDTLRNQPHFPMWVDEPLKSELEKALHAPVYLENDSAMVGLGEATSGAGKGYKIVAYVTVSTGVGGARIVDGVIDVSSQGFEPGNQIINLGGTAAYLETCISGPSLEKRLGKKPCEIADPAVWEEEAELLAVGLNNVSVFWSPDVIVLGGSMITGDPAIPLDRVEYHLKNILKIFPEPPPLKQASLGDAGGLHGALEFLRQNAEQ